MVPTIIPQCNTHVLIDSYFNWFLWCQCKWCYEHQLDNARHLFLVGLYSFHLKDGTNVNKTIEDSYLISWYGLNVKGAININPTM